MTTHVWSRYTVKGKLSSGLFGDASNWTNGAPLEGDALDLRDGRYTVSARSDEIRAFGSLTIGHGATLRITGDPEMTQGTGVIGTVLVEAGGSLVGPAQRSVNLVADLLINHGTIGGFDSISLTRNYGNITGARIRFGEAAFNNGVITLINLEGKSGKITASGGTFLTNEDGGILNGNADEDNCILLTGSIDNRGVINANTGTVQFTDPTNYVDGVLTGGTWNITSTLMFCGSSNADRAIYRLEDADVTYAAAGAQFLSAVDDVGPFASGGETLERSLSSIDATAALRLHGGAEFHAAQSIELGGTLELDAGTFDGSLQGLVGSVVQGNGLVAGDLRLDGTIIASGGTLEFGGVGTVVNGAVLGAGTVAFHADHTTIGDKSRLAASAIDLTGDVTLEGPHSYGGTLTLHHGSLELDGRLSLTASASLGDGGSIVGAASLILTGSLSAMGEASVGSTVFNAGSIAIDSGATLQLDAKVIGRGSIAIGDAATLIVNGGAGVAQTIGMAGEHATLQIDAASRFAAHVTAFGSDDAIVLAGLVAEDANTRFRMDADGSGGTLLIFSDAGRTHDAIRFDDGVYAAKAFTISTEDGASVIHCTGSDAHGHAPVVPIADPLVG